jgi:hypothetical protein
MSKTSKQMLKAILVWLVIVAVVSGFRYSYYIDMQLDKAQYLQKLKEMGYDISDTDSAIANAKTKATKLNEDLAAAYKTGYKSCGPTCAYSRNRDTCCMRHADSSRSARLSQMSKPDQDLIDYYDRYTTNYRSKIISEGIVAAIAIPLVLFCLFVTGGRY